MTDDGYPDALPRGYHLHWYLLERVLGQGGFGITYLARDTNLDQRVAIKEYLPTEVARRRDDASVRARTEEHDERYRWGLERFIREARTLARFDHPNIVRVLSVFEFNNTAYMVMRFEEGSNLAAILEQRRTLPEGELLRILPPILDGLELVHNAGFIHRDIKPDNIHIRADGSPVLLDFGSARQPVGHSPSMTILVAPGYAPFEQYYSSGESQGPWTDIYGLGATCYRAISGVAPMDAIARSKGVLGSAREVLVPAKTVGAGRYSERLLAAIDHALEFAERDRPQSIAEWRRELPGAAEQPEARPAVAQPSQAPSGESPAPAVAGAPQRAALGRGWPFWVAVGAVVALIALAVAMRFYKLEPTSPQETPEQLQKRLAKLEQQMADDRKRQADALKQQQDEERKRQDEQQKSEQERQRQLKAQAEAERKQQEELARRQKLAQQADAERKRREAQTRKLQEQQRQPEKAPQQTAPSARPAPSPPAELLAKADHDYAAGKYADAVAALKPLAEGGNAGAQRNLARAYAQGHGVAKDAAVAASWYRKAALQGNSTAQLELGGMYANGRGVPQNDFEAYVWYSAAARCGSAAAKAQQERIAKTLQPMEIAQAGKLVANLPPCAAGSQ